MNNYTTLIDKHLKDSSIGRSRLRDITTQNVRQYLSGKLETLSPRTVPLPEETIRTLNEKEKAKPKVVSLTTPDLVFPGTDGKPIEPLVLTRYFTRLCNRNKIKATLHDLRHTYATNLALANVHPARAQYLLGHATAQMTLQVYTHIKGDDMAGIAEIVAKSIDEKEVVK